MVCIKNHNICPGRPGMQRMMSQNYIQHLERKAGGPYDKALVPKQRPLWEAGKSRFCSRFCSYQAHCLIAEVTKPPKQKEASESICDLPAPGEAPHGLKILPLNGRKCISIKGPELRYACWNFCLCTGI